MEKIQSIHKKISKEYINDYSLSTSISIDDIPKIIDILNVSKVETTGFRLSNSQEQPEHFLRVFPTLKDLYSYPLDNIYIEEFGVNCVYNDIKFYLTFGLSKNQVTTFTKGNINLEPLLMYIEESCKKKAR